MKKNALLILLAVLAVFAPQTMQARKEMALQLYSIRTVFGNNNYAEKHAEIFKQLHDMGYTAVEAASYNDGKLYGVDPAQFKADLAAAGLTALSSHTTYRLSDKELADHDFTKAMQWWDKCIAAHKAAGMKYIVTPWGPVPKNLKDAQTLCDYHNAVGEKCNAAGIRYGYHTHSHEYKNIGDTKTKWIQYMMDHIDAKNMFWEMDVYWCVMAHESPVEWFKKYPSRFTLLHIKDKYELGESGMVNFSTIFKNSDVCGLRGYIVELERTDGTISIMEGVKRSADYLNGLKDVKKSYDK